jgi:NAD(P)-dependent dehydrogenase (short-subunit alcohol dehydrogenase family)
MDVSPQAQLDFSGRIALVAGGVSGIDRAVAQQTAR